MDIKETFNEIMNPVKENINTKLTNPFFGTLIIVWLFHNWELLVTIVNISDYNTIDLKIKAIADHFRNGKSSFLCNFLTCVIYSFGVLIFSYLLLSASLALTIQFARFKKWIFKKTEKSAVVYIEDYLKIKNINESLILENEKNAKEKLEYFEKLEKTSKDIELLTKSKAEFMDTVFYINKVINEYFQSYLKIKKIIESKKRINYNEVVNTDEKKILSSFDEKKIIVIENIHDNIFYTYRFTTEGLLILQYAEIIKIKS